MHPDRAFCLSMFGVLGIYCELIWPGRVWPGVAGAGAVAAGWYFLWLASPAPLGLTLLAAAGALFILDACLETCYVAGLGATAALAFGFTGLIAGPQRIQPALAVACCLALGALTMVLNHAGRRARRNKRVGLPG
jgi:membrane-bound serine protease (ClpP class)